MDGELLNGLVEAECYVGLDRYSGGLAAVGECHVGLADIKSWRPRGDSGPLGAAEALSRFAPYVPYLATVGAYGVLVGR